MKVSVRNLIAVVYGLVLCVSQSGLARAGESLLVFSPASMTEVMQTIATAFTGSSGNTVKLSIAGTAQLARQIDSGAPADVFISADEHWVDWLNGRQRLDSNSVRVVAGNDLVIAVRNETENWIDPKALLTDARFAMAEPLSIPAGRYTKQALEKLGIWKQAQSQAVFGENVRITLRQLALGEVGAAVVYATDVTVEPAVKTAWTFPAESYDKVQYLAASTKGANREAVGFMKFLLSKQAQGIFKAAGFKTVVENR